jgi:hypothetical protein
LILPVVRRWPNSFDALALSVGAAMPDITDTLLSFPINGYFRQWYGHAWIGIFTLDLAGGLLITWCLAALAGRLFRSAAGSGRFQALSTRALPTHDPDWEGGKIPVVRGRARLRLWSFSVFVGILSHIGFDLISHDTNLLFYPWYENVHWLPAWWYTIWLEIPPVHAFGRTYSVGVFSVVWGALSLIGIFSFLQFFSQEHKKTRLDTHTSQDSDV